MIKKHLQSGFVKNVFTLVSGSSLAQLFPILISPVLTRIYTPEDFGLFALYLSVAGLIGIISTGRYELAIVIPESEKVATNLLALAVAIAIIISCSSLIAIILFNHDIALALNNLKISNWLYFLPVSILFMGLFNIGTYWYNRNRKYKKISQFRILRSLLIGGGQLGGNFIQSGGLIIGNIAGLTTSTLCIIYTFVRNIKNQNINISDISIRIMVYAAKRYKDFPMVNSMHAFSDIARDSISIIIISNYFSETTLGYFALTLRLLKTPISFFGSAVGQVFFKEGTLYLKQKQLHKRLKEMIKWMVIFGLPIFIGIYFLAVPFFEIAFGSQWSESGEYGKILVPLFFLNFVNSPLSIIPLLLEKQKIYFGLNLVRSIVYILIFAVGGYNGYTITGVLIGLSIAMSGFLLINIFWIFHISKNK